MAAISLLSELRWRSFTEERPAPSISFGAPATASFFRFSRVFPQSDSGAGIPFNSVHLLNMARMDVFALPVFRTGSLF